MDIKVELKPHVGVWQSPIGPQKVTHPQDIVFMNDTYAGYVGHQAGAHISMIIGPNSREVLDEIKKQVDALRKAKGQSVTSKIVQAKVLEESNVKVVMPEEEGIKEDDVL